MRGERIQIPLKAGHNLPISETPFQCQADGGPTLNAGLVAVISRGSGTVLLRNPIAL